MSYAAREKYDEPGRAQRYRSRSERRNREEWALLARALDALTPAPTRAWDVPCGTGRVAEALLARGVPTWCGDLSPAMRAQTETRLAGREGFEGAREVDLEAPAEDLPTAEVVICFRFFHHLPDAATRARVLRGLRALTTRDVLLSFHHPVSAHNATRRLRRLVGGPRSDRYTLWPRTLRAEAQACGLRLQRVFALGRWRRELWLAHLRRA